MFGTERDEVTGEWRRLHNEYCSLNVIRVIKSRRMRWAGHVAYMRDTRNGYRVSVGQVRERDLDRP
jgi:hypothetical protein